MKNFIYTLLLVTLIVGCNRTGSKEKQTIETKTSSKDVVNSNTDSLSLPTADTSKQEPQALPIHGELDDDLLAKYFPGVTDTIQDLRIVGSEEITLTTENGIIVSMLHNTATFDQMILCTHDSNLRLIDHLYIGKETAFDGTSHTIKYKITTDNQLKFDHVDWEYVEKGEESEIDTVHYFNYLVRIDTEGKITKHD